jgi:S1-C subfamily serine protease
MSDTSFSMLCTLCVFIITLIMFLILINYRNNFLTGTNDAVIRGLLLERNSLLDLLGKDCDNPQLINYWHGYSGPVTDDYSLNSPGKIGTNSGASVGSDTRSQPNGADNHVNLEGSTVERSQPMNSKELSSTIEASIVRVILPNAVGSGVIINENTILTNRHVVAELAHGELFITSKALGGEVIHARVVALTPNDHFFNPDFAILKADHILKNVIPIPIADDPEPLDQIVAAGYPFLTTRSDINQVVPNLVLTTGSVSVLQPQRNGTNWVIHTAPIEPGSSGGGLINRCGVLVGLNTLIGFDHDSRGRTLYALSASSIKKFLDSTREKYISTSSKCGS